MQSDTTRIIVRAKVENLEDPYSVRHGLITADRVRALTVDDAVDDTTATGLLIPARLIVRLGLRPTRTQPPGRDGTPAPLRRFEAARLTIRGRDCITEVLKTLDDSPILIGRIPLLALDWVVDPIGQRLIGNPEHGGQHMAEAF